MTADFTYFPFLRTDLSSAVTTPDTAAADPFVKVSVVATVNGQGAAGVPLRLASPGEIRGLDVRTVAHTDPVPGAMGVPPNLFPAIELEPPDLPWMFTPLAPAGARLRPWLCLVVTEIDETGEPVVDAAHLLPVLHVDQPGLWLPDPGEAWAWAHVAAAGDTDATGLQGLVGSGKVVARLVCPRRLRPERRYVAALVPVFEQGRVAGLGGVPSATAKLTNAWSIGQSAQPVDLPVYYSWQFHTGVGGDFRSLALRLQGRALPAGAGSRPLDITSPGGGLPDLPGTGTTKALGLEGALQPEGFAPTDWDATEQARFATRIGNLVNTANTQAATLGPPLWGRWPAAQVTMPATVPAWLRDLNTDPRNRAAAGYGARVVQEQREQLMAQAWEQVGEVERANRRLRHAQLARAHGQSIYLRRLPALADGSFLLLTRPLHDRVIVGQGLTAFGEVSDSSVPERLFDGALRRLARPRGALGRRLGIVPGAVVEKVAARQIAATPPARATQGAGVIVTAVERAGVAVLGTRPGTAGFTPLTDWQKAPTAHRDAGPDSALMAAFRGEVVSFESWRAGTRRKPDVRPPLDPKGLRVRIMGVTNPDDTVARRTRAVVTAPRWSGAGDPLEPIMAAPVFPQPMVEPLAAISQELVLPGLDGIPADTVTAAVPNTRFIAAYMVGLSHELARELLFNEYPTDQRGTYFRQFWDTRGRIPPPAPGTTDDIEPIDGWAAGNVLGADVKGGGSRLLIVIVRGELLRRYPKASVYAAPAKWNLPLPAAGAGIARRSLDDAATPLFPLMRGRLEPDLVYFGLQLTAEDARGTQTPAAATDPAGWFVVFEQHPTEPHYGLDEPSGADGSTPTGWDQVTWGDVAPAVADSAKPREGRFVPASQPSWWSAWPSGGPSWGASSAAMAAITLQRPTRLALHASDLLRPS